MIFHSRVILASIRDNGQCPCVWCKIPKSEIYKMGSKSDMVARIKLKRVETEARQHRVARAREHIFELGLGVNSAAVEELLKEFSYVPTIVSNMILCAIFDT